MKLLLKEAWAYIGECWHAAVQLRERRRQMWALLAALLALPLVWLLGGKIEPTPGGAFWIAVWATTSAFITLFVIAPFHLWKEQADKLRLGGREPLELVVSMSAFDLSAEAEGHFGTHLLVSVKNNLPTSVDDVSVRALSCEREGAPSSFAMGQRLPCAGTGKPSATLNPQEIEGFRVLTLASPLQKNLLARYPAKLLGGGHWLDEGIYKVNLGLSGRDQPERVESVRVVVKDGGVGLAKWESS